MKFQIISTYRQNPLSGFSYAHCRLFPRPCRGRQIHRYWSRRLLFTHHCSARCFRTFCAEIPSFSARNRIFLRFLCIAKRVTGHGVNSNYFIYYPNNSGSLESSVSVCSPVAISFTLAVPFSSSFAPMITTFFAPILLAYFIWAFTLRSI